MAFVATFYRNREQLVAIIEFAVKNRGFVVVKCELAGSQSEKESEIRCHCNLDVQTQQGDLAEIRLGHGQILQLVLESLQNQGYNKSDLDLELTAAGGDSKGVYRHVVCFVTLKTPVANGLTS